MMYYDTLTINDTTAVFIGMAHVEFRCMMSTRTVDDWFAHPSLQENSCSRMAT
jgi:hypothetical protein